MTQSEAVQAFKKIAFNYPDWKEDTWKDNSASGRAYFTGPYSIDMEFSDERLTVRNVNPQDPARWQMKVSWPLQNIFSIEVSGGTRITVMSRDTVYIRAAAVQAHYKGEDYDAWVSGWELSGRGPALDSIYVYPQTRYITTETISVEPRKRWGIGIQAGYGIGISSGQVRTFPYIGVGISYDLIRW